MPDSVTSDRDREVERICSAALDREPADRAAFLSAACAGDEPLRQEVESLLARERIADDFLAIPALEVAARAIARRQPLVGQQIGAYKILSLLGAGGMGEVYRARDITLKREVAIKVLPTLFMQDPDRQGRFEHEAQVLASLNHPNIGAIYGLEHTDGARALVLELVEGPTLADRIVHGPLPMAEAHAIGRQIVDALEAAHEKGIIHRDLKPANIKVTADGVVKVLDFGLAKAIAGDASDRPFPQSPADGTRDGLILGTVAYMSPEQARGKTINKQTDIWAFGCLLYEMITGRVAFAGETSSDTLAAVLGTEPEWRALPKQTTAGVRRLLERCLKKDPKRRLHDIADARIDLDDLEVTTTAERAPAIRLARWPWALVAIGVASLLFVYFRAPANRSAPVTRFSVAAPEDGTFGRGSNGRMLAVSPDGKMLAVTARVRDGRNLIWLRALDALTARAVAGTEGAEGLFWSPDSLSVGFFAFGKLKTVSVERGEPRTICDVTGYTTQATWNQAGVILFVAETRGVGGLLRVSAAGGRPVTETTPDRTRGETGHLAPYFLPDGQHFLYNATAADGGSVNVGSLGSKDRIRLFNPSDTHGASSVLGTALAYAAPGYVLFVRDGTLMAQPFDAVRLERAGELVRVVERVQNFGSGSAAFSVSANGVLAYWSGGEPATSRLAWFSRDGRETAIGLPERAYGRISLSPDAARAAVEMPGQSDSVGIWVLDLTRHTSTAFTSDAFSIWPLWSPDGASVIFSSSRGGMIAPYRQPVAAGEEAQRLFDARGATVATDWSSDGRAIVYASDQAPGSDVGVFPVRGSAAPRPLLHIRTGLPDSHVSPDGRWIAYVSTESGPPQIYVSSFLDGRGKWLISTSGGQAPRWRRDGKELYYLSRDRKLMAVTVKSEPTFDPGAPVTLFSAQVAEYAVANDGRFLLELPAAAATSPPITLVLNWTAALKP